jgi:hypothetical protein
LAIVPGDGMYRGRRCRSRAFPVDVTRDSAIISPENPSQPGDHKGRAASLK